MKKNRLAAVLQKNASKTFQILDTSISIEKYLPIDFSVQNKELAKVDLSNPYETEHFINNYLKKKNCLVAYGGYNEERNLYKSSTIFSSTTSDARSIHLGIDFWVKAGTSVRSPLSGKIHSFKNNTTKGDYGPTIILEHTIDDEAFYTLYGHLSATSLNELYIGKEIKKGEQIACLGVPEENVNYAPHLHFQIIKDLQGKIGDYPGVCTKKERAIYLENCPDPNLLLHFK